MKTRYLLIALTMVLFSCGGQKTEDTSETEVVEAQPEYVGEEITYSTDSTSMNGYMAYNKNDTEKRPGILVIHEWWGHNDYARLRADMLAELGYVAFAVDMYGDGKLASHPKDAGTFMNEAISNLDETKARFEKAMETLKAHPGVDPEKIGAIGYCFGGAVSLSMANAGYDLDAVAAFHSSVGLPFPPAEGVRTKYLICNGEADPFIKAESVEAFKAAMDSVGADYEYVSYPGVMHSFTSQGADSLGAKFEMPFKYDAAADQDSWEKMQALFKEAF